MFKWAQITETGPRCANCWTSTSSGFIRACCRMRRSCRVLFLYKLQTSKIGKQWKNWKQLDLSGYPLDFQPDHNLVLCQNHSRHSWTFRLGDLPLDTCEWSRFPRKNLWKNWFQTGPNQFEHWEKKKHILWTQKRLDPSIWGLKVFASGSFWMDGLEFEHCLKLFIRWCYKVVYKLFQLELYHCSVGLFWKTLDFFDPLQPLHLGCWTPMEHTDSYYWTILSATFLGSFVDNPLHLVLQAAHDVQRLQPEYLSVKKPNIFFKSNQFLLVLSGFPNLQTHETETTAKALLLQAGDIKPCSPRSTGTWNKSGCLAVSLLADSGWIYRQMSGSEGCLAESLLADSGWIYGQMSGSEGCLAESLLADSG